MKILYHHRTRAEDAQGIHIEEIQRAFRELGHDVVEVAMIPRGGAGSGARPSRIARAISAVAKRVPRAGYELLELAANGPETLKLTREIAAHSPDFVYERYSLHNAAGVLAARRAGVPIVLEVNAPLAEERAKHGGLSFERTAKRVEAAIWRSATAIVTVSGPLKSAIVDAGVDPDRVLVLHNAVRRSLLTERHDGNAVRAKLGIPPTAVVCGFTGWFRPWHGLESLLEAFADSRVHEKGAVLLLVGEGQALGDLMRIANERGIGKSIRFAGAIGRAEIFDYVAAFDLALQPAATAYASPMKIFEYLALGKPVVAAATPAIKEILTHGRDGLLFPEGEWRKMVDRIDELVSDTRLRERLARRAKETIETRGYLWDENARKTIELVTRERAREISEATATA